MPRSSCALARSVQFSLRKKNNKKSYDAQFCARPNKNTTTTTTTRVLCALCALSLSFPFICMIDICFMSCTLSIFSLPAGFERRRTENPLPPAAKHHVRLGPPGHHQRCGSMRPLFCSFSLLFHISFIFTGDVKKDKAGGAVSPNGEVIFPAAHSSSFAM